MSKKHVSIVTPSSGYESLKSITDYGKRVKRNNKSKFKRFNQNNHITFEEKLRQKRCAKYTRELNEAIQRRLLWKQFQRELEKDFNKALIRSVGPEWWQEPSTKQIVLATTLGDVIRADKEEGVTGRTRQWLLDLGVAKRLTPKQVRTCMKQSLLNPVDFLLEVHHVIVPNQEKLKKIKGTFSVDERLLLSAVCVLHLPALLTMLHYMLPPPEPLPNEKYVMEVLYGDLNDETIRYATPYMEPLPFRDQDEFRSWAFDSVYKALLPSIIENIPDDTNKRGSIRKISSAPMTPHKFADINPTFESIKNHSVNSSIPTVCLISEFAQNRLRSVSMVPINKGRFRSKHKSENGTFSFSRQLNKLIRTSTQNSSAKDEPNERASDDKNKNDLEGKGNERMDMMEESGLDSKRFVVPNGKLHKKQKGITKGRLKNLDYKAESDNNAVNSERNNLSGEPTDTRDSLLEISGLQSVWSDIEALPKDKQLAHAIAVLAEAGDPLAQLPRVHKLPSVKRWFELRRGEKRILTQKQKDELLTVSRRMWKSNHVRTVKDVPKVKCTKKEERALTWDKKNWLRTEITNEMHQHFTRVREAKVDNARSYFLSMLNQYDLGSNLIRNFRDTYFTYLPAREADLKVFRPWKP